MANVRRQHCTEIPGRDRGIARAIFRRDDMVLKGTEAGSICSVLVINMKSCNQLFRCAEKFLLAQRIKTCPASVRLSLKARWLASPGFVCPPPQCRIYYCD